MSPVYRSNFDDDEDYAEKWHVVRIVMIGFVFGLLFLGVAARAFYIQIISSNELIAFAKKQNNMKSNNNDTENDKIITNNKLKNNITSSPETSHDYIELIFKGKNAFDITMLMLGMVAVLFAFTQILIALYPLIRERRVNKILIKTLGAGPFDEETIRRATKFYVLTKYMDCDPCNNDEIRTALTSTRKSLIKKVDTFIKDDAQKYLMIFADSGMGKTTFVLNYYAYNCCKSIRNRISILLLPLAHTDLKLYIENQNDIHNTVLILDGLDEDTKAINNQQDRLDEIFEMTKHYRKIIITCRTQFFCSDDVIPSETSYKRIGPRSLGSKAFYSLPRVYISPFDDKDIKLFLDKYYSVFSFGEKSRINKIINQIPYLNVRPMLLTYLPDAIKQKPDISFTTTSELYKIIVDAWLERESLSNDTLELLQLSENIAVDIYVNRELRGIEAIPTSEIKAFTSTMYTVIEEWKITGRSLLNRDSYGNYKFAHRSIMEYLFVKSMLEGNPACLNTRLTDLMMRFVLELRCKEWKLNSNDIKYIINHEFTIGVLYKTSEPINNKVNIASSLKVMIDKFKNTDRNITINDITSIISNKSILHLLRDLSLSLIEDEDGILTFNPKRTDAFWFKSTIKPDAEIDELLDIMSENQMLNRLPYREQIGVLALLLYVNNNIGLNMLSALLNLSQNEIFIDYDTYNKHLIFNIYMHDTNIDSTESYNDDGSFRGDIP